MEIWGGQQSHITVRDDDTDKGHGWARTHMQHTCCDQRRWARIPRGQLLGCRWLFWQESETLDLWYNLLGRRRLWGKKVKGTIICFCLTNFITFMCYLNVEGSLQHRRHWPRLRHYAMNYETGINHEVEEISSALQEEVARARYRGCWSSAKLSRNRALSSASVVQ